MYYYPIEEDYIEEKKEPLMLNGETITNNNIKRLFCGFLKANKCYDKYRINCQEQKLYSSDFFNMPRRKTMCSPTSFAEDLIDLSFTWGFTNEGYQFWQEMDNKWRKELSLHEVKLNNDIF